MSSIIRSDHRNGSWILPNSLRIYSAMLAPGVGIFGDNMGLEVKYVALSASDYSNFYYFKLYLDLMN
jgi:hypothetical protein